MSLLLPLLAALASAPDVPSPPNPLAGESPGSISSIRVRRFEVQWPPGHGRTFGSLDCVIDREHAPPFVAAAATATPLQSQRGTQEIGFTIFFHFDNGRDIGLITSGRELFNGANDAIVMIDGRLYSLGHASIAGMRETMAHCRQIDNPG